MAIDWTNYHRYQEKDDYCGVAVIQMILSQAGIKKSQKAIAKDVFIPWWGVSQQIMLSYLSRYFAVTNYKNNSNIGDVSSHLKKDHAVVLNWWDDLDDGYGDGHYTIVAEYSNKTLALVDPSRGRSGIWDIKYSEFRHKWYDTLTLDNKIWTTGWMLWVDPKSIRR
jgi:ABC-type bacteriocin/lantibiotic exporter with double-glycine peptidase domain